MPLWLRRIIYLSFIALFVIVAPVLTLYSMGYRYHWGKHRIERTGLLIVDGEPRDVTIRIDGTPYAARLPARFGGLGENEYALRIEREGFHPWEQRVGITSGHTTIVPHVRLFRDAEPTLIFTGAVNWATISIDQHWLAIVRSAESFEELWLWDLKSDERTLVLRTPRTSPANRPATTHDSRLTTHDLSLEWSPRGATLLVRSATDAIIITPGRTPTTQSLLRFLPAQPTTIAWELGSDRALVANVERRLFRVNITTGRATALAVPAPEGPFALARGTLYVAEGNRVLAIPTDGESPKLVAALPTSTVITRFMDLRGTQLDAETTEPTQLLTIGTTDGNVRTRSGFGLRWTTARDAALWQADVFELWAESGTPAQPRLLVRRETPLIEAVWHPEGRHVIFATARDVAVIGLDPSSRPATSLATFDEIRAIAASPDGNAILIVGKRGTKEGAWQLPLR